MRQNYDKIFLQSILDRYDGLGRIDNCFLFTSGYENSNYFVETGEGKYVIKIFEGIGVRPENILYELEVMDYSFRAGVKTPRVLKDQQNKLAVVVNKKYACIMDFIEGQNMDKLALSDELVARVGREAGKMDLALKYFKDGMKIRQDYEFDIKSAMVLEKYLPLLLIKFEQKVFKEIFKEFKKTYPQFIKMPTGLIHNDIVPYNFLAKDGKLSGIIDFSDMEFSPYIQNIAVALHLIAFAYNYNPGQAKLFIEKYGKINLLSGQELKLLYILIKVRMLSFVVEFNRWNVEYGVDQQRVETVNDNYEFLKRFNDFGQEGFNKSIGV